MACANGIVDGAHGTVDDDAGLPSVDAGTSARAKGDASTLDGAIDTAPTDGGVTLTTDAGDAGGTSTTDASIVDAGITLDAALDAGTLTGLVWKTPTCDGVIGAGEYGTSANQGVSGTQTWSVTWDAQNLYVALDGANLTEAAVLYVGHSGAGLSVGQTYDGTRPLTLSFAADAVVYAKQGYTEVRTPQSGAWGAAATSVATFCGKGTTRELVLPWSALGSSGVPKSFRWVGYAVSASSYVYAAEPTVLPAGFIGTSTAFAKDLHVASTANGTGTFPFQLVE
jgi:hypothetical protein